MEYRPLGKTGLSVSVAGLGCGGNSRLGLGRGASVEECVAVVRTAVDLGVNHGARNFNHQLLARV